MKPLSEVLWLPPLMSFVLITGLIECSIILMDLPAYLAPRPSAVALALWIHAEELLKATRHTGIAAITGLGMSAILGALLAITLASHPLIRRAFYPYAVFFQTVPIIAIAPMLVIWFGYGQGAVVAASFIVSVSPIIANTLTGLLSTDPALLDLFRIAKASRLDTLFKLRIPGAIPHFLTGLRIASGLAVIGAIVGEFVADSYEDGGGIGTAVEIALKEQRTDLVFAAVLMSSLLGLLIFWLVSGLNQLSLKYWHLGEFKDS